jgi:peptidoglycan/LPS O-acetylase OafA/YrhL
VTATVLPPVSAVSFPAAPGASESHDLGGRPGTGDQAAPSHVPALDGVRGIAVALVMAFHIWRVPATALGWSGVDLFFVLSGFLITGILWDTRAAPNRARAFYSRRALRILPLYYGVLVAVFIIRPLIGIAHRRDDLVLAGEQMWYWTYLCDWRIAFDHPHGQTFLTHFWSLSIEEQFYLAWPVIVWRCTRRATLGIAGGIAAGALVLRCLIVGASHMPDAAYALLPCRLDALAVGAIVALAVRGPKGPAAVRRWIAPAALAGLATVVLLAVVRPSVGFVDPAMMTIGYTALDWAFAGLVFAGATARLGILECMPLRLAGRYSYGLYVYHPLVMWWIVRDAPWLERRDWTAAAAAAIGSILIAWVSYHLYEQRFLRLRDRWAPRTTAPA